MMEGKDRIRVLLVDDHQVVRDGLRHMLGLQDDIRIIGEAANVEEALQQAELHSPDIVLMDLKMPGVDGIEAVRRLKEKRPDCHVIMLTLYEEYVTEAIEAGATGYLLKDIKREELVQAIRAVQQGRAPLSPLSRDLLTEFSNLIKGGERSHLSERELEVLRLISSGATTKEIGAQLFLSEATVKRDVQHIFEKLDVRNRSEAIAEAYKRKLIQTI
ncbi:MAG: response regulator transcription factor [Dehalococcoidia bacterium]|nr:response regulator transcription factor [Dehalococcoidia bacterium]